MTISQTDPEAFGNRFGEWGRPKGKKREKRYNSWA